MAQPAPTALAATKDAAATFTVTLTNHGPYAGAQKVLAFARPKGVAASKGARAPRQKLFGYAGATLAVGESKTLTFSLGASHLAQSDAAGNRVLLPGNYEIAFSDGANELKASLLTVSGEATVVEATAFRAKVVEAEVA